MIQQALRIDVRARYCGTVEIPIPEHIDVSDTEALKKYVDSIWEVMERMDLKYVIQAITSFLDDQEVYFPKWTMCLTQMYQIGKVNGTSNKTKNH